MLWSLIDTMGVLDSDWISLDGGLNVGKKILKRIEDVVRNKNHQTLGLGSKK